MPKLTENETLAAILTKIKNAGIVNIFPVELQPFVKFYERILI